MLVIVSDIHLTDGTTGNTIGAGAFRDFRARLGELVADAARRADGSFVPPAAVDLVLLGDIFDVVHSARWHLGEDQVRPWEHRAKPRLFRDKVAEITGEIITYNADALAVLKGLSSDRPLRVQNPASAAEGPAAVPVNVHYVVGNHDWYYHLPGPDFEPVRAALRTAMGLANEPGPFPHEPEESPRLLELFRRHRTYARHGDQFDSFNYEEKQGRDGATLGDAIVVGLVNRFPHAVRQQLGDLPLPFLKGLDELANVRPSLLIPVWIEALVHHAGLTPSQEREVKAIWNRLAEEFIDLPFVRERDRPLRLDDVDTLQATLHLSAGFSFSGLARLATFIQQRVWKGDSSYARHAPKEPAYLDGAVDHVVYGHTHHHEVVPLDIRREGERAIPRFYLNAGTWHAIHQRTLSEGMVAPQFAYYQVMTYLAFFTPEERGGRPFETWSGTLGVRRE